MTISNKTLEKFKTNFKSVDFIQSGINDNDNGYINYIMKITNCDKKEAQEIIDTYDLYIKPPSTVHTVNNIPKCITCGSANIKRISATSKVANTVAFGLLGTKRNKTFHCNNCGYEW